MADYSSPLTDKEIERREAWRVLRQHYSSADGDHYTCDRCGAMVYGVFWGSYKNLVTHFQWHIDNFPGFQYGGDIVFLLAKAKTKKTPYIEQLQEHVDSRQKDV